MDLGAAGAPAVVQQLVMYRSRLSPSLALQCFMTSSFSYGPLRAALYANLASHSGQIPKQITLDSASHGLVVTVVEGGERRTAATRFSMCAEPSWRDQKGEPASTCYDGHVGINDEWQGTISENARGKKGVCDARRAVCHWQEAGRKAIAFGGLGAPVDSDGLRRILMEVTGREWNDLSVAEMPSVRKVFKGKINNTFCGLTAERSGRKKREERSCGFISTYSFQFGDCAELEDEDESPFTAARNIRGWDIQNS
ncbi:hypothetical protein F5888DRAFT_1867643 [Russula emetica]|nr:hypothetical protein F5888DRAFT_1867643 [Russula emetica]